MKEELIKYLTKIVDIQEKIHWFKWNREDLKNFQALLNLDIFTMEDKKQKPYWESIVDLIRNK